MHTISQYNPDSVVIFTDGSSSYPNNGTTAGGWAFHCKYKGDRADRYGYKEETTNNEMELYAVLQALRFVPKGRKHIYPFTIYTDSKYVQNAICDWSKKWMAYGWKTSSGEDVKNKELINEAVYLYRSHCRLRLANIKWIRGHSGIPENELVDQNAGYARKNKVTNWKDADHRSFSNKPIYVPTPKVKLRA